jgi:hypothetical protein
MAGKNIHYYSLLLLICLLSSCEPALNLVGSLPYTKTKPCCYLNASRDTVFFNCKNQRVVEMQVRFKNWQTRQEILFRDSSHAGQRILPLQFVYDSIPRDSLLHNYFHIVVVARRTFITEDYWFIPDSNSWRSKEIIHSYIKNTK